MEDPDTSAAIVWLKLAGAGFLLLLQALYAAAEIGLLGVGRVRIKRLADEGERRAQLIERMFRNPTWLVATVLVTITSLLYFAEALATDASLDLVGFVGGQRGAWLALAIPSAFIVIALIFAQLTPILYASFRPERVALTAAYPMRIASFVLYPLIALVTRIASFLLRLLGCNPDYKPPLLTEAEIIGLLEAAEEQGIIEKEERKMLGSALEFTDIRVSEVMIPRVDIVRVLYDAPLSEAIRIMTQTGHSRLPVYKESVDDIVGILYAKDALAAWRRGESERRAQDLAREPIFAHETERIHSLLKTMQSKQRSVAIIVDEKGGTSGLVTIEDLVEEVLGEIHDEYDQIQNLVQPFGDHLYLVDAQISIRQVEKLLDVELPEEEYDTLAELVTSKLERLPVVGDRVEVEGIVIEVAEMHGRRLRWVKLQLPAVEPSQD